jgi:very-short-patch-repair endonuclease
MAGLLPARRRPWLALADGRAGSGTETLVRLALQAAGIRVTPQVKIPGVGFVDLLVGTRVVVEIDSESWHSTAEQRAEDYRRDLLLHRLGYAVVRVSYEQAMRQRSEVVAAVIVAVRASRSAGSSFRHRRSQLRLR